MNDIYIALVFLAQELVVEPSFFFPGRNLRYLCANPGSFHIPLHFLWVGSPLLCTAVACGDGGEI